MSALARAGDRPVTPSLAHLPVATRRLLDLDSADCRWPLGDLDTEAFAFCAAPRLARKSYCAHHARLAREGSR